MVNSHYSPFEIANYLLKRIHPSKVTFVGEKVRGMAKMKALQNRDAMNALMTGTVASLQYDNTDLFTASAVAKQLLASGGAHKPSFYDFGDGNKVSLEELYGDDL